MKVILAIDGTKQSIESINITRKLNFKDNDEIWLISVIDMALPLSVDIYAGYLPATDDIEKAVKENVAQNLSGAVRELKKFFGHSQIAVFSEILTGSPERRIVEKAEEIGADLIVVGSHGYNRWERLLLGSVSDSVLHHAPCSVLIVRDNSSSENS